MSSLSSKASPVYCRGPPSRSFTSSTESRHDSRTSSLAATMPPTMARAPPSLGQLNPEQRQRVYEEVLNSERPFLCKCLEAERHMPHLKSRRCFDRNTQQRINHHVTTLEKNDAFIDEILRGGLNASVAFFESLEQERVTQHILTRLLESCHAAVFRMFHEGDAIDNEDSTRLPFDLDDEREIDNQCISGHSRSSYLEPDDESSEVFGSLDSRDEDSNPPLPRLDVNCLRKAQGLLDSAREGEEASDISSTYELTSHGAQAR